MLQAGELCRFTGSHAVHGAGERFEDQILGAIGEHRNENEQGKAPRARFAPDVAEGSEEAWSCLCFRLLGLRAAATRLALDAPYPDKRQRHRNSGNASCDGDQPAGRIRVEKLSGDRCCYRQSGDHHQPNRGCRGGALPFIDAYGQQHQQGRAAGACARADGEKGKYGKGNTGGSVGCHKSRCAGGKNDPGDEHHHTADNPWSSPPADVGSVAPAGAQNLNGVVKPDQCAGQHRRKSEFHHHDPVEG